MRLLKFFWYGTLIALFLALVMHLTPWIKEQYGYVRNLRGAAGNVSGARVSLAYELSDSIWTSFPVQPRSMQVKVVSNAGIMPQGVNATDPLDYTFAFQILGAGDRILDQGEYHHLTRQTLFHDPLETNATLSGAFYLDSQVMPLDGRVFVLDLARFKDTGGVSGVRFRLVQNDPRIDDVVIRVYERLPNPEHKLDYLWSRLSRKQREKMARGNVYPQDFLEPGEIRNLMRMTWHPVGPAGIPDREYFLRRLYIVRDLDGLEIQEPPLSREPVADAFLHCTLPIPENGMDLRFRFEPLEPVVSPSRVRIRWYGKSLRDRSTQDIPLVQGGSEYSGFFAGGMLECTSTVPVRIIMLLRKGDTYVPLERDPMYKRTFVAHDRETVVYDLGPGRKDPVPFRLELRLPDSRAEKTPRVNVRLLTAAGTLRSTLHPVISPVVPSLYDRIEGDPLASVPSDPRSLFLLVPPGVTRLEVTADGPVLVSAATRPLSLARRIMVPEDAYRFKEKDNLRQPAWFPLYPLDYRRLYGREQSVLLSVQYRPPEDDPDLAARRYVWESFTPTGTWRGGQVVVPVREALEIRSESLTARFFPLSFKEQVLDIRRGRGETRARPVLMYLGAEPPMDLAVMIDGKPFHTARLMAARGTLTLPSLPAGRHRIRVQTGPKVRVFMNQIASLGAGMVLRSGFCLENPLSFVINKRTPGQEIINVEFYSKGTRRTEITTRLTGPRVPTGRFFPALTIPGRVFSVRPGQGMLPVLSGKVSSIHQGENMLIFMGEDLPPGRYVLDIERTRGPAGYIAVYRVIPGIHPLRRIFHE